MTMIPPSYVSAGWAGISAVGHAYLIIGTPTAVVRGNLLIATFQSSVVLSNLTAPVGWTLGDISPSGKGFWLFKIADGTEGDSQQFDWTGTTPVVYGQMFQYFGIEVSDPFGIASEKSGTLSVLSTDGITTTTIN